MTAPFVINCVEYTFPTDIPQLRLPYGILKPAFAALDKIPHPGDLLAKFLDMLSLALAPLRQLIEVIETIASLVNCVQAIPKAVMSLSPAPIFDCLKNLLKAFARLVSYIPPLSYIRTMLDIANFVIFFFDQIVLLFVRLDAIITEYIAVWEDAMLRGDVDLVSFVNCGMADIKLSLRTIIDFMRLVKPITDLLMPIFLRLMPTPSMQKAADDYAASGTYMDAAAVAMAGPPGTPLPDFTGHPAPTAPTQHSIVPVPPIGPLLMAISVCQSAFVVLYNIMAPIVGEDPDKVVRPVPSFTNF